MKLLIKWKNLLKMRNKKLLLHTCCAPCVLPILEYLKDKDLDITLYYFNPNILNREEYKKRLLEVIKVANIYKCKYVFEEYDHDGWVLFLKKNLDLDLDKYTENGLRCRWCLYMRLKYSFVFAKDGGYDMISSCFLTNLYKDSDFVRETLVDLTKNSCVEFFDINVDKKVFYASGVELCKKYDVYRQKFCGCEFSC